MKRAAITLAVLACAAGGWWAVAQLATGTRPLSDYLPSGALLEVEARDFAALLKDWNASPEKALWLKSENYQVFSRSRIFARLGEAQAEYAAAAGFPASMPMLDSIAGSQAALGIYDIGKLEFLYVTRLDAARVVASGFGKNRGAYASRRAAGIEYFVRIDPASKRVAAFATANGLLVLATREDLIAGALLLVAGQTSPALRQDPWFAAAVKPAGSPGEIRMAGNLRALTHRPHFQSYWIQRNITELRQYEAFVSDLNRSGDEIREKRLLVRASPPDSAPNAGLGSLPALVPPDATVYQAWSQPAPETAADLIRAKLLAPRVEASPRFSRAPDAPSAVGAVGSESDLETRIDEASPATSEAVFDLAALRGALAANRPEAMLIVESSALLPDGVFVGIRSAIVLAAKAGWNAEAVRSALTDTLASVYSTSRLGLGWRNTATGSEMDGLLKLAIAARGNLLIIADDPTLLASVLARPAGGAAEPASYAAGYRHARELPNYTRLMRLIDEPQRDPQADPQAREPQFFSENLASLGRTLARLDSATLVASESGVTRTESVVYRLRK